MYAQGRHEAYSAVYVDSYSASFLFDFFLVYNGKNIADIKMNNILF